jgi:hypothetical protein
LGAVLRRPERDYLAIVSLTFAGIFVLATFGLAVIMAIVEREHVAAKRAARGEHVEYARANQRCERNKPSLATGWTVTWNAPAQRFTCIYDRNGRRVSAR